MNPFEQAKEDTQRVIHGAPGYFLIWYTFKSVALVGAVAVAAYQLGKNRGSRSKEPKALMSAKIGPGKVGP